MLGTEHRARSRRFATFGWALASLWLVPAACGGDLLINYDDGRPNQSEGGAAGAGDAEGGAAGLGVGGESATGGVGGAPTNPSTGGSQVGSGGKGGGTGGTSASGGTSAAGGTGGSTVVTCGNGNPDEGEECDDGNVKNGDGCSSSCVDTSVCDDCMDANCIDGAYFMVDQCAGMPGVSTTGNGSGLGRPKGELCWEMVECIHRTGCFDAEFRITPCFCGDADGETCFAGMANGPCYDEIYSAVEAASDSAFLSVGNLEHPSGYGFALVLCTHELCSSECHGAP